MIHARNVSKSYKNIHALKGVDLHVERGTVKALLGPNGAGKTTLVRILATLLDTDSGEVTIDGLDGKKDVNVLRTKIGLTGQYAALDPDLTGFENLRMFGRLYHLSGLESQKRAHTLLKEFGLSDASDRVVKNYSGGMRRRLDLAASLIVNPPVLFLDEPTTGLDPKSRIDLWNIIEKLVSKGTTVLLTTQYLEEADYLADSISVIHKGEIVAEGTADDLKDRSGGNVLEVTILKKENVSVAQDVLSSFSKQDIVFDAERLHFSVPIDGGAEVLIEAVRKMDSKNLNIVDIQLRKPTLDDVFIALTGEDAGADSKKLKDTK